MQKSEVQPLLENERSGSQLSRLYNNGQDTSTQKSMAINSFISAMVEYRLKDHQIGDYIDLAPINESISHPPIFNERGADTTSKDNQGGIIFNQKPRARMSHIYPTYISSSDSSIHSETEKIQLKDHLYNIEEIEELYQTSVIVGLSEEQAARRLRESGENIIKMKRINLSKAFHEVFNSFSVVLIVPIILQLVGFFIDQREKLSFLVEMIGLIIIQILTHLFTFTSYLKKKKLVQEYKEIISADSAIVIRGGYKQKISSSQLVKGDLIEIVANARVPADCRIVSSNQLSVDNYIFTGDCQPILLEPDVSHCKLICEARNLAFFGTGCVHGEGKAIVVNTGNNTLLGQLSQSASEPIHVKSFLNKEVNKLIRYNTGFVIVISCIALIGWYFVHVRKEVYLNHLTYVYLINVLTLIILSTIPMTLKLIVSLSKHYIGNLIQKQNIYLSNVDVIEQLSQISVLLINKESILSQPQKIKKLIINSNIVSHKEIQNYETLKECIYYNTFNCEAQEKLLHTQINLILYNYISQYNINKHYNVVAHKPFTQMEKFSLTITSDSLNKNIYYLYLMGTPDFITTLSDLKYDYNLQQMQKKGYTLISCAIKTVKLAPNYEFTISHISQFNFPFLDFQHIGTLALKNSINKSLSTAIQKFQVSGIKVVLMTGESPEICQYLADEMQLQNPLIIDSSELNNQNDIEEDHLDDEQTFKKKWCLNPSVIYSRFNPAQKLMVIQAYQKLRSHNFTVGMLGFETIDSPAIRKSDVGFAFNRSDELIKQSAKVLLYDQNLNCLEQVFNSILLARTYTDNLIKQIKLCFTIKGGQIVPVLFMLFLGIPLALTSFGIIYITLTLDIIIFSLIFEKQEIDVSFRNPRRKDRVFEDAKCFLKCLLINGGFAASCGLISYVVVMYYLGFQPQGLVGLIYDTSYSSRIDPIHHYPYNGTDQYLGNINLRDDPKVLRNPFLIYQFYKHFGMNVFDLRNVIVTKQQDDSWITTFGLSNCNLCKEEQKEICYSMLSLDIAQLSFIFGYIMWGWFHIYQNRSRIYSFKYQLKNRILNIMYCISVILCLCLYIPYSISYGKQGDGYFYTVIGLPSIPILICCFILSELMK